MQKRLGFSLIELLIAIAIVSILSTVAVWSYNSYIRKSRRTDGISTLLGMSLAQEKYRMNNSTYGTLAQIWGGNSTSDEGFYTLSISNVTATGYTLSATPTGDQANDTEDGTSCSPLTLTVSSGTITKAPAVCWPK